MYTLEPMSEEIFQQWFKELREAERKKPFCDEAFYQAIDRQILAELLAYAGSSEPTSE